MAGLHLGTTDVHRFEGQGQIGRLDSEGEPEQESRLLHTIRRDSRQYDLWVEDFSCDLGRGYRNCHTYGLPWPGVTHSHDGLNRLAIGGLSVSIPLSTPGTVV